MVETTEAIRVKFRTVQLLPEFESEQQEAPPAINWDEEKMVIDTDAVITRLHVP